MKLFLEDGTTLSGKSFGAPIPVAGEVVFSTGMVGYVESFTDPSYAGQILVCTYPLVGNYGVPDKKFFESRRMHIAGLIVSEECETYSHADAKESLSTWLKREKIPALSGIDTRALTLKLREKGVMLGQLSDGVKKKFIDPNEENLVARVSVAKKETYGSGPIKIVAVDCGMKENIVRSLTRKETSVIRVPWDYDFSEEECDGVLLSNGPGDPTQCEITIKNIQKTMKKGIPILGVCLGNQLLALAAGAKTYKLKYGHRSHNQPCIDLSDDRRCYITSQNHGFAVDEKTLPSDWRVWFTNANDESVEGIRHRSGTWKSVQFHPEASPGPTDTGCIFDDFLEEISAHKKRV